MISIQHVEKMYKTPHREIQALRGVSLEVGSGEIVGVIGRAAAGKSSLLRCINLLERPTQGKIIVDNINLMALNEKSLCVARRRMGMISSSPNLLDSRTVFENVAFPLEIAGKSNTEIEHAIVPLLALVGLADKAQAFPSQLNESQKHRVALARALALRPKILLIDDPEVVFDTKASQASHAMLQLLKDIHQKYNLTILLFTKDMNIIKNICHRVAVLHHGEIIEHNTVINVCANPNTQLSKDFIKSTSRLELPIALRKRLRATAHDSSNPIVRISFINAEAEEAVMADIIQHYQLSLNIMQAHVENIQNDEIGIMIAEMTGDPLNIQKALEFLASKNLYVEVLGHASRAA